MKNDCKKIYIQVTMVALLLAFFVGGCSQKKNSLVLQEKEQEPLPDETEDQMLDSLAVTFLDVGQGNATLIENDGKYMLIDGGDREYSSFVVSYLKEQGIEELEYVIVSHYDADHLNGIVGTLNAFSCETVLAPDYTTDTRVYESFYETVEEKEIELVYPAVGQVYTFGEAEFTVVTPDHYEYADVNDNSIGIRLVHGENSFLICGDAGIPAEEAMLESDEILDSDVYLANHHGSEWSSSWEFLQAVSPETVVFSVGADNSYGHPTERVLSDVEELGAEIYRTDMQGTITAVSDGTDISWSVASKSSEVPEEQLNYILNQNTKKFHLPSCDSAGDIAQSNKAEFSGTREELIDADYEPCKRCNP